MHVFEHCTWTSGTLPDDRTGFLEVLSSRAFLQDCGFRDLEARGLGGLQSAVEITDTFFEATSGAVEMWDSALTMRDSAVRSTVGAHAAVLLEGNAGAPMLLEGLTVDGCLSDALRVRGGSVDVVDCRQ